MQSGWYAQQLPVRVRARIEQEEAHERVLAAAEEQARADRAEEWHQRNLSLARDWAEARGDVVSALQLARGEVRGRSIQDIFAGAIEASARQDAVDSARLHRDGHGEPERLHVEVGEPQLHYAVTPAKRAVLNRSRRWREYQERRAAAEAARAALDAELDHGIIDGVELNREREPQAPAYLDGRPLR
jgi:hypothetical protein